MIVLVGEFSCGKSPMTPYLIKNGWGRMWARDNPSWEYDDEPWGFDNGAFTAWKKGLPFPHEQFRKRLDHANHVQPYKPIVAVAPDIVGQGEKSLQFSVEMQHYMPSEWPTFLALQDGMSVSSVRKVIHLFDGLFLGGTDEFKKTALVWAEMAHGEGGLFHFARCNREKWLDLALRINTDSIDTSRPIQELSFGTEKGVQWFKRFEQIVTGNCPQQRMEFNYDED